VWLGLILTAAALVLIVVPARLRRAATGTEPEKPARAGRRGSAGSKAATSSTPAEDDDLAEIEAILKRRGIQ
jgi:hypothetical protein